MFPQSCLQPRILIYNYYDHHYIKVAHLLFLPEGLLSVIIWAVPQAVL